MKVTALNSWSDLTIYSIILKNTFSNPLALVVVLSQREVASPDVVFNILGLH
jgi:hypothetical protein